MLSPSASFIPFLKPTSILVAIIRSLGLIKVERYKKICNECRKMIALNPLSLELRAFENPTSQPAQSISSSVFLSAINHHLVAPLNSHLPPQ
jgi:hypothetical protein